MPAAPVEQYLTIECPWCGKKHGCNLTHYQVMRGSCGRYFWALQPKRNGPLQLFPHIARNALLDQPYIP
jgi:hypothetical protein